MAIAVGSIYFVGYFGQGAAAGANTSAEGFAILVKNPIAAGEVLNFTDGALQANGTFGATEQTISFTVPAGGIAANSVLQFPLNGANANSVYLNNGTGGRTAIGSITPSGNTGLSNSGDQIFAYQGTLAAPNPVLAGIDVANGSPITTGATTTNTTYAPTNGAPFVNLPQGTNNVQIAIDPTTATPAQLTDPANFTQQPTTTNPENSFSQIACFCEGTLIETATGKVPVEELTMGVSLVTADGQTRTVKWIGRQTIIVAFADPVRSHPIRVQAGALAEGVPARDLVLSHDHALLIDGVLVQAGALVNGTTVTRMTSPKPVFTYYHVETEDHAIILAEGTPAETFVSNVTRRTFDNYAEYEALFGDRANFEAMTERDEPRAMSGRQVPATIKAQIASRAAVLMPVETLAA